MAYSVPCLVSGARRGAALIPLLCLSLVWSGCKESPGWAKAGQLFSERDKAFLSKVAVVYVYWPWEERGRRSRLWVQACDNGGNEILPGGYTSFVVEPGSSCFQAEASWDLWLDGAFVSEQLGKVEIRTEAGHSSFIRLERKKGFLPPGYGLRWMAPEAAAPEIRRCRQSTPLY
ncbi:MAG TPA: hypothetical protein VFR03_21575 [Thermoanaerobaculia bacterium]|nr:hypothetical protein [Thermoanaerobaculia bacterium]